MTSDRRLRVLLVHEQDVIHWGFRTFLLEEPWVERFLGAYDVDEAVDLARRFRPQVAVIDVELAAGSADELCDCIYAESPRTHVLLLSHASRSVAYAEAIGATGVVPKTWAGPDIAEAARKVGLGMTVFEAHHETLPLLNEREAQVLTLLATGATNREIGERLGISTHTVKDYTGTLYRKLKARNRAEAILRGERMGLLRGARSGGDE